MEDRKIHPQEGEGSIYSFVYEFIKFTVRIPVTYYSTEFKSNKLRSSLTVRWFGWKVEKGLEIEGVNTQLRH